MSVLMINGSPHRHGSTWRALCEVGKGLEEYGIEYEIVQIGNRPISGCMACGACHKPGAKGCVLPDAELVNSCVDRIGSSEALVLGTPVYFASSNSTLTALLDRVFSRSDNFAGKPGASVAAARRAGASAALDQLNKYFTVAQMPVAASSYWNMVYGNDSEETGRDEEGLRTMRNLGRNLAWLILCIRAGEKAGIKVPDMEY